MTAIIPSEGSSLIVTTPAVSLTITKSEPNVADIVLTDVICGVPIWITNVCSDRRLFATTAKKRACDSLCSTLAWVKPISIAI